MQKKQRIFRLGQIAKNERKTEFCSVCKKRNIDKEVLCPICCSLIHRKYCNLKNSNLLDVTRNQSKWHWECSICICVKFAFNLVDNKEVIRGNLA